MSSNIYNGGCTKTNSLDWNTNMIQRHHKKMLLQLRRDSLNSSFNNIMGIGYTVSALKDVPLKGTI